MLGVVGPTGGRCSVDHGVFLRCYCIQHGSQEGIWRRQYMVSLGDQKISFTMLK
jgi:hypothetical protein